MSCDLLNLIGAANIPAVPQRKCVVLHYSLGLLPPPRRAHCVIIKCVGGKTEAVASFQGALRVIIKCGEEKRRQNAWKNLSRDPRDRRHKVLSKIGMTLVAY